MTAALELTKQDFADLFGLSTSQLERLFQQGMPHERRPSRRVVVPMPSGRLWYHKYLRAQGARAGQPNDLEEAKKRKLAAEAELAELDLAKARGAAMLVDDAERIIADAYGRVRAKLLNLPARMAGVVLGATTIQDAQARLQPVVVEVLDELRAMANAPPADPPADAETPAVAV